MDIRDKKIVWLDQEVFDIAEAAGVTASANFLVVVRDKMISQLNHLTIVVQQIPDLQKEVSILEMYIGGYGTGGDKVKLDRWKTDLITKTNELDHLKARKEVLIISIKALQIIMESILWELKE
jgi:hypothetical protein